MKIYHKVSCNRNCYADEGEISAFVEHRVYEGWCDEDLITFHTDCDSNGRQNGWALSNFTVLSSGGNYDHICVPKKVITAIKKEIGI